MISIVMPSYNAAPFLSQSIGSVLSQTYKDWELIIVDDGSTDDTAPVAEEYARQHRGISVYSQMNSGPTGARNLGLSKARGEFLTFLDADDRWDDRFLETMLSELLTRDADIVMCDNYVLEYVNGELRDSRIDLRDTVLIDSQNQYHELLKRDSIGNPSCVLTKRKHFDDIGGWDSQVRVLDCWEVWARFFRTPKKVILVREPLFYYYIRNDGSNITRRIGPLVAPRETLHIYRKHRSEIRKDAALRSLYAEYLWDCGRHVVANRYDVRLFPRLMAHSLGLEPSLSRPWGSLKSMLRRVLRG